MWPKYEHTDSIVRIKQVSKFDKELVPVRPDIENSKKEGLNLFKY